MCEKVLFKILNNNYSKFLTTVVQKFKQQKTRRKVLFKSLNNKNVEKNVVQKFEQQKYEKSVVQKFE